MYSTTFRSARFVMRAVMSVQLLGMRKKFASGRSNPGKILAESGSRSIGISPTRPVVRSFVRSNERVDCLLDEFPDLRFPCRGAKALSLDRREGEQLVVIHVERVADAEAFGGWWRIHPRICDARTFVRSSGRSTGRSLVRSNG